MRINTTISDLDRGFNKLVKSIGKMGHSVDVGVFGDEAGGDMVIIAYVQEFGNPNNRFYGKALAPIPARPFLRGTIDRKKRQILTFMTKEAYSVLLGKVTPERYFERLGEYVRRLVVEFIHNRGQGTYPENAQTTIDRKKGDIPLVDNGLLVEAITFRIYEGK